MNTEDIEKFKKLRTQLGVIETKVAKIDGQKVELEKQLSTIMAKYQCKDIRELEEKLKSSKQSLEKVVAEAREYLQITSSKLTEMESSISLAEDSILA